MKLNFKKVLFVEVIINHIQSILVPYKLFDFGNI